MSERVTHKPSVPLFGGSKPPKPAHKPQAPAKALEATPSDPDAKPDDRPKGVRKARYNLTVRLSEDERDRLATIGRTEGKPNPMTLAETVRWLISQWRR